MSKWRAQLSLSMFLLLLAPAAPAPAAPELVLFRGKSDWFARVGTMPCIARETHGVSPTGSVPNCATDQFPCEAVLASATTNPQPALVRPLPGGLDSTFMVNSNSPEVVQSEGILVSTFPSDGKKVPGAHLNFKLKGKWSIFAHHINKAVDPAFPRTLYLAVLVGNPGSRNARLKVTSAATYDSQPDAPFIGLPPVAGNDDNSIFAGPGDRATGDVLRRLRQDDFPASFRLSGGQTRVLLCKPIPVKGLDPPLNGRSALLVMESSAPVCVATLAMFARLDQAGAERAPTTKEWLSLLENGGLAGPREREATLPEAEGAFRYGRVSGVQRGTVWNARLSDAHHLDNSVLNLPEPGQFISYVVSTVDRKVLGTNQIQSAPLVVRYPDTAYKAHGNYGVLYDLKLPLYNGSSLDRLATISLQTPASVSPNGPVFVEHPPERVFYRGTVKITYVNETGCEITRYFHVAERSGELVEPLVCVPVGAGKETPVTVQLIYPPDATPPQVITVGSSQ